MADNDTIKDGTGASVTVANDDIGGVKYPRFKAVWGPDGTANDTDVASGKPMPVQHRVSDGTAWTYGAGNAAAGSPRVVIASDQAAVATSPSAAATGGYSFLNIAAGQATTVVKASAGTLHSIILNSAATATNTTVVYDHPSGVGTVIGRPAVTTATVPTTLIYDIAFANGLTIITATANGGDMTVCYK